MLIRISSADNSRIRLVRKLASRKGRAEEGLFVAEGRNLVSEILERNIRVRFIMVPFSMIDEERDDSSRMIKDRAASPDVTVCAVPDRVFSKLTDAGHGVDMLAVCGMIDRSSDLKDITAPEDNILVLDRIQDPGNMGTLIRTAAAAGYKAVLAMSGTADIYSPKVLRATAGMVFEVPVIYVSGADILRQMLDSAGKRIVVTDVNGGVPYYDADLAEGIALVVGNEGRGVSEEIAGMADIRVTIPMKGNTESLNAAAAAAILMYESIRIKKEV